jgi:hypothetical protein
MDAPQPPPMAMNTGKVVVGGLVAGVVSNVLGYLLFGMWLGPRFEAETVAAAPMLAGKGMSGSAIGWTVATGFVVALVLAWLYAAMRPRFGPGAKTAIYAGLIVWVLGFFFHIDLLILGLTSMSLYMMATVAALVQTLATAWVAGMLYKEEGAAA